jgi:hypothetical protein
MVRKGITRVCNCILALANAMIPVSEDTIRRALEASNAFPNLADLLLPGTAFFDDINIRNPGAIGTGGAIWRIGSGFQFLRKMQDVGLRSNLTLHVLCCKCLGLWLGLEIYHHPGEDSANMYIIFVANEVGSILTANKVNS